MKTKWCSKCGVEKLLGEFHKAKGYRGGYHTFCKACIRIKNQTYYQTHKKKMSESHSIYQKGNSGLVNKLNRKHYKNNKKQILEKHRKYRLTDAGKLADRRGKHKRRALMKELKNDITLNQWNKILDAQHNQCNICHKAFNKKSCATMDHIIPLSSGGDLIFENVQALCGSCNSVKHAKLDPQFIQTWLCKKTD